MSLRNHLQKNDVFGNSTNEFKTALDTAKTILADFRQDWGLSNAELSKVIFTFLEGKRNKQGKLLSPNGKILLFSSGVQGLCDLIIELTDHLDTDDDKKQVAKIVKEAIALFLENPEQYVTQESSTWLPSIIRDMVTSYLSHLGLAPNPDLIDLSNILDN